MKKTLVALVLGALVAGTFAGCGDEATPTPTAAPTATP